MLLPFTLINTYNHRYINIIINKYMFIIIANIIIIYYNTLIENYIIFILYLKNIYRSKNAKWKK